MGIVWRASIALALLAGFALPGCERPVAPAPVPQRTWFSILTYNIDAYNGTPQATVDAIVKLDADVVCLQEVTPAWEKVLRRNLRDRYPSMSFFPDKEAGGIAVLSRWPLDGVKLLPPANGGWMPAARATAQTPIGPVDVLAVHLRPMISDSGSRVIGYFKAEGYHRKEIETLAGPLDLSKPTLIAGDFNEADDGQAIKWLAARGWTDTLVRFDPITPTWHGKVAKIPMTDRLDHVLISPALKVTSAQVHQIGGSDHYPVFIVVERAPQSK